MSANGFTLVILSHGRARNNVQSIFLDLGSSETSVPSASRVRIRYSAEATEESLVRGFARISTEFMIRELISTALAEALVSGHYERPHDRVADCPLAYLYRTPSSVAHFPRARRLNDLGPLWLFAVYFSLLGGLLAFHD